MLTTILMCHFLLSILTFFIINFIGKHSVSFGYVTLSAFVTRDEAPAFNLLYRVISPVILIIIYASALYILGYDEYTKNIWMVALLYCLWRLFFIFSFGRVYLVNWIREVFIWVSSTSISWLVYEYFIKYKSNLLPQPEDLKNEFWLLVILFVYSLFNKVEFNDYSTIKRKEKYLFSIYQKHKKLYHGTITSISIDALSESLIYAVLLYENFNRPYLARVVERLCFPLIAKSIGPMQVKTEKRISDTESVSLGAQRIVAAYRDALEFANQKASENSLEFRPFVNHYHMAFLQYRVAANYNKDSDYVEGVQEMHRQLLEKIYPTLKLGEKSYTASDMYVHYITTDYPQYEPG